MNTANLSFIYFVQEWPMPLIKLILLHCSVG